MRGRAAKNTDDYFILDRDQNFYPNPGQHFFKSRLKISLPAPLQCLASGSLRLAAQIRRAQRIHLREPGQQGHLAGLRQF